MRRSNALLVLGLILLVAGAAALVYGIITYNEAQNQAVIEMIAGGAAALVGLAFLLLSRRRRR